MNMVLNPNLILTVLALYSVVQHRAIEPIPIRDRSSKGLSLAVWSFELDCLVSLLLVERWSHCYSSLTIVKHCKVEFGYVASASIVESR